MASGFKIVDFSIDLDVAADTDWLSSDFQLPTDFPEELMTFLHLDFNLPTSAIVSITKNGTSFPINNNAPILGAGFRSIPIKKGVAFNIQCSEIQANAQFTLALET